MSVADVGPVLWFMQRLEFLDCIVKASSKHKGYSRIEEERGMTGTDMLAIATPGQFCLVKVRYDGEMLLNGENFSHIL